MEHSDRLQKTYANNEKLKNTKTPEQEVASALLEHTTSSSVTGAPSPVIPITCANLKSFSILWNPRARKIKQQMHDEVSETENIRQNLAIERMIIGGCDILLDVNQG